MYVQTNPGYVKIYFICCFFQNDPLLRDLDTHVTLEEVNSMIALEYGQAMVVNIRRVDNEIVRKYF